jgi:hypothetical protein
MPNTGNIIVSTNGTTWSSITPPNFQGEPSVQSIAVNPQISAYGDGMFIALTGYVVDDVGQALYSGSVSGSGTAFDFQGDLQLLSGDVVDLMSLSGTEDLNV